MDKRDRFIKEINRSLAILRVEIEQLNKINLTDYNIIAEDFYRDLLVFYGYKLENLNETNKNADSIDLVDKENKIAIQVTSRNDTTKIHKTINGFYNNSDYQEYKQLILLLIGKSKLDYSKTDFTKGNLFSFDKKNDIIDINDIVNKFSSYTAKQLEPIVTFLESEIDMKINTKNKQSNEVITIIKMIEYLSDDKNYKKADINEEGDPDNKRLRFVEHFDFLMEKYEKSYSIYAGTLIETKKISGIDGVRIKKINVYLQNFSDDYLTKYSNNPREALNELVYYFENEISSSNTNYDKLAIEFYLLDELIKCNVFPNPKK